MKKVLISILALVFVLILITKVYAATGSISSGVNVDTVIKGQTFTITLTGTADKPIEGMGTKLEYDSEVLKLKSVVAANGYEKISSGNESEIAISITSGTTAQQSATLCTIEFEVLETAGKDKVTVKFNNSSLVIPDEEDTTISRDLACTISDVEVSISKDETTGENPGTDNGDNNPSNTPSDTNDGDTNNDGTNDNEPKDEETEETKKEETKKDDTTKNKTTKLPQTGVESFSVLAIIALGAISIASYVSYKKYKNI